MAELNAKSSKLRKVTSDLQKALECPVCYEVVKQPFRQCIRGHLVCFTCLNRFRPSSCVICEGKLLLETPTCIKNLLECLPRDCCFSVNGCNDIVISEDDHEMFCGFRHVKCKVLSCHEVLANDLCHHFKTVHPNLFVDVKHKDNIRCPQFKSKICYGVNLFDKFFWLSLDKSEENHLQVTFEAVSIGKCDSDYYARVSFVGDFQCAYTLKALPAEQNEGKSGENHIAQDFCIEIPKALWPHFIDKDGFLVYDLFVFKR